MARANIGTKTVTILCHACHARIRFCERPDLLNIVSCPKCGEELQVVGLSPIRIDWSSDSSGDAESFNNKYVDQPGTWAYRYPR